MEYKVRKIKKEVKIQEDGSNDVIYKVVLERTEGYDSLIAKIFSETCPFKHGEKWKLEPVEQE